MVDGNGGEYRMSMHAVTEGFGMLVQVCGGGGGGASDVSLNKSTGFPVVSVFVLYTCCLIKLPICNAPMGQVTCDI